MRLLFGVVMLLVVLAVVSTLGKTQLKALGLTGSGGPTQTQQRMPAQGADVKPTMEALTAPVDGTPLQQSRTMQDRVKNATNAALQQGADRAAGQ